MATKKKMLEAAAGVGGGGIPWDISTAVYNGSPVNFFNVNRQETGPQDVFFKPDGTKLYIVGASGGNIKEYSLSSAWDVSTATYVQNFSAFTQESGTRGISFKTDGTKMYIVGEDGDEVNEYSLSSAWDISTASYVQNFSVASQETQPQAISFKTDGTKMYIIGAAGDDVNEYSLSSAWDISTASYVQNFSVASQESIPTGLFFKDDGTKMYIIGASGDDVNEYSLSSAWNISTASYVQNFNVNAQESNPTGLFFKDDGTKMYITGSSSDSIWSYDLSSAWDISTASFSYPTSDYFSVLSEETTPTGIFFKTDGTVMYIVGGGGDEVNEYSLSSAWEISTASYVQNFSVAAQETNPSGLFFKPDGIKMYITGTSGDDVNEYSLSTAWDISTASYVQNFSVSGQDTNPQEVFFKPDGTKMYIAGNTGNAVNEYSLSSAWDVSTASYVQNFSVSAQDTTPQGLFFKPDGTKMYVLGQDNNEVFEYDLSSAWDISSANYVQNFPTIIGYNSHSIFFKDDGTKMYIVDATTDSISSYDL